VSQSIDYETGPITVNHNTLPGGKVSLVIDGLRGDALDELVVALERYGNDAETADDAEVLALLRTAGQRLLSETLTARLDPISLHVEQADDINGRIGTRFSGAPDINLDDLPDLLSRIELDAGFSASTAALKTISRHAIEHDRRSKGMDVDPAQIAAAADMQFQMMMMAAEQMPFLIVTPERIHAQATFKDGTLQVNGETVEGVDPMAMLVGLSELFGSRSDTESASMSEAPDENAAPLFGSVTLASDFEPDPHEVELVAGGETFLDGSLGDDCIGHINLEQPDFTLHYTTGPHKLFVYAESDADVTLVINAPDGSWQCNDDGPGRGLDPTVEFSDPVSGRYSIWVGTLEATPVSTRLMISELDPAGE